MDHAYIGRLVEVQLKTKDVAMIYRHIEQVNVSAKFSDCKNFRYRLDISLTRPINSEKKIVCAVMQNPSDANSEIADKSVQFLEKLIFTKGIRQFFGVRKLIVVNQFAYIQKNDFSGQDKHVGPENDSYINQAIDESEIILIAWGSINDYEERKNTVNDMLKAANGKTLLLGKSHPSRGSYTDYVSAYSI